jgi:hypothetical protein
MLPVEAVNSNQNSANESANQPPAAQNTGNNYNSDKTDKAISILGKRVKKNEDLNERENKSRKLNGENEASSLFEADPPSKEIDPVDMSDQIDSRAIVPSNDQRALNSAEMEVDQGTHATILRGIIFSAA